MTFDITFNPLKQSAFLVDLFPATIDQGPHLHLMRDPRMEMRGRLSGGRSSILVGEAVPIANGARVPAAKSPASRITGGRCHLPHRENLQQRLFR
jgi:hypothetical protein